MSFARMTWMALLLVLGVSSLGGEARAQGPNPPGYDAAIDEALAAFDHGNFAEARELFLRAHKISPNARTLRALGKIEYELRRYDEAATHLTLALDSEVRPLTEQQRSETHVLLRKCEDFLATYTLRLEPAEAELRLDGAPMGLDAYDGLRLIAGTHVLEASAPGYTPWRRELTVRAHEDALLTVKLTPLAAEPTAHAKAPAAPLRHDTPMRDDAPSARKRRWLLWTSLGVLVAAGAVTGVVLAMNRPEPERASGGNSGLVWTLER